MPSYKTVQVHTLSKDFRTATKIVEVPELPTPAAGEVLVKNHFLGINATDINLTAGAYGNVAPPFGCGLEAAGVIEALGEGVENVKVGDAVVFQSTSIVSSW